LNTFAPKMKYERGKKNWITGDTMASQNNSSTQKEYIITEWQLERLFKQDLKCLKELVQIIRCTPYQPKKLFGDWGSAKMIGNVDERFKQLERYDYQWRSFYAGWIEGSG